MHAVKRKTRKKQIWKLQPSYEETSELIPQGVGFHRNLMMKSRKDLFSREVKERMEDKDKTNVYKIMNTQEERNQTVKYRQVVWDIYDNGFQKKYIYNDKYKYKNNIQTVHEWNPKL